MGDFIEALKKLVLESDPKALAIVLLGVALGGWTTGYWWGRIKERLWPSSSPTQPSGPVPGPPPGPTPGDPSCETQLEAARAEIRRLQDEMKANQAIINTMLSHEGQIWRLHRPAPPSGYRLPSEASHAKILLVANNKGGVGKTTLVMYLAAYFAKLGHRVLAIDLDPQASLTRAMLAIGQVEIPDNQDHRLAFANELLSETGPERWSAEVLGGQFAGVHLVTCNQTLEAHETRLQLQWLAKGGQPDIRYFLSRVLLSDAVQNPHTGYKVVLIDAPPRLSVGSINALGASTHLLVPTKLDLVSAETVGVYLELVNELKDGSGDFPGINPKIELAGVVGTMTHERTAGTELDGPEKSALATIDRGLSKWRGDRHIFRTSDIQDRKTIRAVAGKQLVETGVVPGMFNKLGDDLRRRINL